MDMFTDRLVTVERKMLHFEKKLHIVKLQQSSSGIHNTEYHTSMAHSILHCYPFQPTIHTSDGRSQLHHYDPNVPQINHRSHNQHHHLNYQRQFYPLFIQILHRATQSVSHLLTHLTTCLPIHLVSHLHSNPVTHLPTFSTIHIMTLLIHRQKNYPILQLLVYPEQKQPDQKELDIVQRIQNSVM